MTNSSEGEPIPLAAGLAVSPAATSLRPLDLGEILNAAVSSSRRSPAASFGIAAALQACASVLLTIIALKIDGLLSPGGGVTRPADGLWDQVAAVLIGVLVTVPLTGLLAPVLARHLAGRPTGIGQAWSMASSSLPALLRLTGLLLAVYCLLCLPFAGCVLLADASGHPVTILLAVLVGLVTAGCEIGSWVLFALAPSVLLLERTGAAGALKRSWRLVRPVFRRVLGIELLTSLIFLVASYVVALPLVSVTAALAGQHTAAHITILAVLAGGVGGLVSGALIRPFAAGVTTLLYCDVRLRRDGLDLLLPGGPDGTDTGPDPVGIWMPPVSRPADAGPESGLAAW